jgi:lipopolysaccharide transport system ATP-binding protein
MPFSDRSPVQLKGEVLVRVHSLGKIFCRDLKKSLLYGLADVASEFFPRCGQIASDSKSVGHLRDGEFWANKNISFDVRRGECLGLIGHNGAGKTTLLKMLNGLIKPDTGGIEMHGRVGAIIALGAGFNPILTGRENIYVNAAVLGLSKKEIDERIDAIIDFAEIRDFIDTPVQSYSSGMTVRLGFAVATAIDPDVLILDEVLAVGDLPFRYKCLHRIGEICKNSAVIFVSHDQSSISRSCDRVLLLDKGQQVFLGDTDEGLKLYNEVYSQTPVVQSLQKHKAVTAFRIIPQEDSFEIVAGEGVSFDLEIESKESFQPGLCLISFIDHRGIPAAQASIGNQIGSLVPGTNVIRVILDRLDLASGHYRVNVHISTHGWRTLLIAAISCAELTVKGDKFLWCAYNIPARTVRITNP